MTTAKLFDIIPFAVADVAHLVERHLAKVEVASSSLVIRSRKNLVLMNEVFSVIFAFASFIAQQLYSAFAELYRALPGLCEYNITSLVKYNCE